jgi:hypothetical protein
VRRSLRAHSSPRHSSTRIARIVRIARIAHSSTHAHASTHARTMASHAKHALKARFSMMTDVDLNTPEIAARAVVVKDQCAATTPQLQRLLVHRSYLLALMAVMYSLQLADKIWAVTGEFKTYDDIKRCPTLAEASFLTEPLELNSYYTGWWEKCGATEADKQYRLSGEDTKATGSFCFFSLGKGDSYVLTPLTNVANTDVSNLQEFTDAGLDQVNTTTANDFGIYIHTDPSTESWYSNYTARAAEKVFEKWSVAYNADSTFKPVCTDLDADTANSGATPVDLSALGGYNFGYFNVAGEDYRIMCFTETQDDGSVLNGWYYWPKLDPYNDDDFEDDSVFLYTSPYISADSPGFTATDQCGELPVLERACCTSKEVLVSTKNTPQLIKVRKGISLVSVIMNGLSAICAIIAALNWTNLRLSRKMVVYAWLTPFIMACVLGTLPLAYMAKISATQMYDDTLIKTVDDADFDGIVKFFNILMPNEASNLVDTLQYFYDESRDAGRQIAEVASQIEFRLKTMVTTMLPLGITALTLPLSIEKAAVSAKEMFPSAVWIGWITRIMPMVYMPWAVAVFCAVCQIFSGPYVTAALMCLLLMKIISFTHNATVHTQSYMTHEDYRLARKPSKSISAVLALLSVAALGLLITALLTDKYLKEIGIVALIGEIDPSMFGSATARLIFSILIAMLAKSSNAIVMFNDIFTGMVAASAGIEACKEDEHNALELKKMLMGDDTAPASSI